MALVLARLLHGDDRVAAFGHRRARHQLQGGAGCEGPGARPAPAAAGGAQRDPEATSAARTAQPSIAVASKGGTSMSAPTPSARTRPRPRARGGRRSSGGVAFSMIARASSNAITGDRSKALNPSSVGGIAKMSESPFPYTGELSEEPLPEMLRTIHHHRVPGVVTAMSGDVVRRSISGRERDLRDVVGPSRLARRVPEEERGHLVRELRTSVSRIESSRAASATASSSSIWASLHRSSFAHRLDPGEGDRLLGILWERAR